MLYKFTSQLSEVKDLSQSEETDELKEGNCLKCREFPRKSCEDVQEEIASTRKILNL